MKIFLRTLFYQFFLLFVGGALGFIANAEYIGWKSVILERSFYNIFYPVRYDQDVEQAVVDLGRQRLCLALNGHPMEDAGLTILDEWVWNEEVYIAKYRWQSPDKKDTRAGDYQTRIRWKPWEYYYEYHDPEGANMDDLIAPPVEEEAPAPPQAPQAQTQTPPSPPAHPTPWPHVDKHGKPVPGPVHTPNHPSLKPWWQR